MTARLNRSLRFPGLWRRKGIRSRVMDMAFWDDRVHLPRHALAFVPMLMLPAALGGLVLLAFPGSGAGVAAIIVSTIAVAWYLLGGAIAVAHALRAWAGRRALAAIKPEVLEASDPVWICDPSGLVLLQNDAASAAFGDLTGRHISAMATHLRADAQGEIAELAHRAAHGGFAGTQIAPGQTLGVSTARDAPLQVWSFQSDEDEDTFAPTLADTPETSVDFCLERLPVALLRLGADGRVREANAAARRLIDGLDQHPHLGALFDGPGRAVGDWIADVCAGRADGRAEMLRLREGAGERHFQVSLSPDATPDTLIAVLHDASALKTLEAQFVQSQKMQAIGQLAGGVAHDFNNLLTAITGHCDLLMLRRDKADPDFADLDQISQNANRAAALVGQLLAFSRKQTLKPRVLDLRDILSDLTHLLNRLVGERIALRIRHDPRLLAIRADKRQLEQVIMNLVVNARDAMPQGGDITIRSLNLSFDEPQDRYGARLPAGKYVEVQVADEGIGMAPEVREKIFEPFFTTKRTGEGTGLGLSTAYGIVKQTGGYIFCDTTLGKGTTFSLIFPAHEHVAEDEAEPAATPLRATPPQSATVLLVEDEAPVRAFAARALRLKGFEVLEADSAEAALRLLSDERVRVDVFVTDVVMPGMDGPSWVRTALQDRPHTRVVFMSGYTEDIFGEGHAPVPNSTFLAKPFSLVELTETVSRHLARPIEAEPVV